MGKRKQNEEGNAEVQLIDFVIPAKITAFCEQYKPISDWQEGCDTFTDSQLRAYFKATQCDLGDPLSLYLQALALHGFKMKNDVCGEPVIYAMAR